MLHITDKICEDTCNRQMMIHVTDKTCDDTYNKQYLVLKWKTDKSCDDTICNAQSNSFRGVGSHITHKSCENI
jgi:hypothetical protein